MMLERVASGILDAASRGPSRSLYLYDLGAEVGKIPGGQRPGPIGGNFQHPDAVQGQVFTSQACPSQRRSLVRRERQVAARELVIRILAQAGRRTSDRRRRLTKLVWKAGEYGAPGYGMVHVLEPVSRSELLRLQQVGGVVDGSDRDPQLLPSPEYLFHGAVGAPLLEQVDDLIEVTEPPLAVREPGVIYQIGAVYQYEEGRIEIPDEEPDPAVGARYAVGF